MQNCYQGRNEEESENEVEVETVTVTELKREEKQISERISKNHINYLSLILFI